MGVTECLDSLVFHVIFWWTVDGYRNPSFLADASKHWTITLHTIKVFSFLLLAICETKSSILQDTDFQKTIYPSRLTSMSLHPSSLSTVDSSSSTEALYVKGRLAKLELSDGSSLYAKLVVIKFLCWGSVVPLLDNMQVT